MKWVAAATVLLSIGSGATSCTTTPAADETCADGKGHWITDESDSLKGDYSVVVSLCVDDGGNVLGMEVD